MRVLMISLDRRLLQPGDVVERHQKYADLAGGLDIIVFSRDKLVREWSRNLRIYSTGSGKFFHYRAGFALASRLNLENKYDLIVTQDLASPVGLKFKKLFNTPFLISFHSMFFTRAWLGFDPRKWYLFFRIKRAANRANGFRVVNSKIQEKLAAWGLRQPTLVEPTPVDIQNFFVVEKSLNLIPAILFVGRLTSEKNVKMLIEAFKRLRHAAVLRIVGEGPERKKLEDLAYSDKRIEFLGQKTHRELPAIYEKSDIFVLPSDTESFGWVLLEAAAARCTIISTTTPGAASIIKNGETGILIDPGNISQLKAALEELITSADLRQKLAEKAQEAARGHDANQAISRIVNFWKEIGQRT